jgi:Ca2+-binding RTX toxin-like protein
MGDGNDTVTGGDGNYTITVGNGNDVITVGNGNDTITTGTGDDAITVGTGTDRILLGSVTNGDTITGFQNGDTIDLVNTIVNETFYDAKTGVLKLYDATYGQSITTVGSLTFNGAFSNYSFALASDGSGGTNITLGPPSPTASFLADLSDAAYTGRSERGRISQAPANQLNQRLSWRSLRGRRPDRPRDPRHQPKTRSLAR